VKAAVDRQNRKTVVAAIRDEKSKMSDPAAGGAQTHDKRWDAGSSVQLQTRCGWNTFLPTFAKTVPSISEATRSVMAAIRVCNAG
jgi:hypothetical protein